MWTPLPSFAPIRPASQIAELGRPHLDIVNEMPRCNDRVEAVYLSARALKQFRTESSGAARISSGEPFHAIQIDHRWLIDWYQLRRIGIPLEGPPPTTLVPEISEDDYVEAVRQHMIASSAWAGPLAAPGAQAYTILTMCRALRTLRTRQYVSKREAARWACEELPEACEPHPSGLDWREHARGGSATHGEGDRAATERFVRDVTRLVDET
jgi:hypothetical protein